MHIFLLDLSTLSPEWVETLFETLPPARRAVAERCTKPAQRHAAVAGFCLLRHAIRQLSPLTDAENWLFTPSGKPYLAGEDAPHFNLSHTAHLVAVAVDDMAVGVDVEEIRPHHEKLPARICSPAERSELTHADAPTEALVRIWCAKEAYVKCTGEGLRGNLRNIPSNGAFSARIDTVTPPHYLAVYPSSPDITLTWVRGDELQ